LKYSADPVSQAANSLIELIDRLLRDAFSDEEVLAWIQDAFPGRIKALTYVPAGRSAMLPTKLGQALCLAYGAQQVTDPSLINETAAVALTTVRRQLQALKHADTGSPAESLQLVGYLSAIEGCLLLMIRLGWSSIPDDQLNMLRSRLPVAA